MKFFLLRRFSHLIHRRTRSDSDLAFISAEILSQSLSFSDLPDEYSRYPRPNALNNPAMAIFATQDCIHRLEKENAQMELVQARLRAQAELKTSEFHSYQKDIASEDLAVGHLDNVIGELEKDLYCLELSVGQFDDFWVVLLDIDVFNHTRLAITSGSLFMDAVVDSIRTAAEIPHGPWSTLIPPVIGERTKDQYASVLNVTLKARSDLRQAKNLAQHWKTSAEKDGEHHDIITPSASTLSDVQEVLPAERQKAVDALWLKLKTGELPIRSTVVTQAMEEDGTLDVDSDGDLLPSVVKASSLFMPSDHKSELETSAAASMATLNASLLRSSSSSSLPSTPSGKRSTVSKGQSDSENSETISPLPRLSLFSSDFWAAASDSSALEDASGSESVNVDFTTEDALQSLKLIYSRFNTMKVDTNDEAGTTTLPGYSTTQANTVPAPGSESATSGEEGTSSHTDADELDSELELEADFVFVTAPVMFETPLIKRRTSILQSLNLSSKIPRKLSISLSPTSAKSASSMAYEANKKGTVPKAKTTPPRKAPLHPAARDTTGSASINDERRAVTPVRTPIRNKTPTGKRFTSGASKRPQREQDNETSPPSSHSLFRPTISSSLKQSKQSRQSPSTTRATSPLRVRPASPSPSPQFRHGSKPLISSGIASSADSPSPLPVRTQMSLSPAVLLSPTKISNYHQFQSRPGRAPVQHHRSPPPIPVARALRGKENAGVSTSTKMRGRVGVVKEERERRSERPGRKKDESSDWKINGTAKELRKL